MYPLLETLEVLVCDDGSEGGETVVAAAARSDFWIFLDGDLLLNPFAISAYVGLFEQNPNALWGGYFGYVSDFSAPSDLVPGRFVNYLDQRYPIYSRQQIQAASDLRVHPGKWFWGGSMGIPASIYHDIGGFDEQFVGWGNEDTDFAFRALEAGYPIHFSLDTWAEHQEHGYQESFHREHTQTHAPTQSPLKQLVLFMTFPRKVARSLCPSQQGIIGLWNAKNCPLAFRRWLKYASTMPITTSTKHPSLCNLLTRAAITFYRGLGALVKAYW